MSYLVQRNSFSSKSISLNQKNFFSVYIAFGNALSYYLLSESYVYGTLLQSAMLLIFLW